MKIAVLAPQDDVTARMIAALRQKTSYEITVWPQGEAAPADDFEVLVVMGKTTRAEMEAQPALGLVQTASAGYEGIDLEAASELGIWVAHSPSQETGNATSVAEHAILLLLATSRRLHEELELLYGRAEDAARKPATAFALYGKTVCLVGLGGIGHKLVERLRPFGVSLNVVDPHPEHGPADVRMFTPDLLTEAIAEADYVVLALPASPETENLFDAQMFAAMQQGAILINVARGSLVDEQALLESIRSGHLSGAGLDVVREEPISRDNPLLRESRILVTPHIAGFTGIMFQGTVDYLTKALGAYERGSRSSGIVNEPATPRKPLQA